jgi:hypothetical protein
MECAEFAAQLSAALDETLEATKRAEFAAHRLACPNCQALHDETSAGLEWLRTLKTERLEPPARLMTAILSATSQAEQSEIRERQRWWRRLRNFPQLGPLLAGIRQPRFAMSFAMAFFSLSLLLNVSGLSVHDLLELRPESVQRALGTAEGKVLRYYDNLRFVYEIESRVRQLKREAPAEPPAPAPEERPQTAPKNRSAVPERGRSYGGGESSQAAAACHPGVGKIADDDRRTHELCESSGS